MYQYRKCMILHLPKRPSTWSALFQKPTSIATLRFGVVLEHVLPVTCPRLGAAPVIGTPLISNTVIFNNLYATAARDQDVSGVGERRLVTSKSNQSIRRRLVYGPTFRSASQHDSRNIFRPASCTKRWWTSHLPQRPKRTTQMWRWFGD
jgi:hypothetical protein